jgi:hypothetical protein
MQHSSTDKARQAQEQLTEPEADGCGDADG